MKVGGGTPPILTPRGWLELYHGVEAGEVVGAYRPFWALLGRDDPSNVLHLADEHAAAADQMPNLAPDLPRATCATSCSRPASSKTATTTSSPPAKTISPAGSRGFRESRFA